MLTKSAVKYIQSLQQKKFRDEYDCFVAEGPKIVEELWLQGAFACRNVYATQDWAAPKGLADSGLLEIITEDELQRISGQPSPNRVLAVFEKAGEKDFDPYGHLTLVLDDLQDPGNVGTIIRTADWFGVRNIVCTSGTADRYNPKVVQGSMASLGRVNVVCTDVAEWLGRFSDIPKFAASLNGDSLRAVGKVEEGILIIGNESSGIRPEFLEMADKLVKIPGAGKAESLNAAVATAIILYVFAG